MTNDQNAQERIWRHQRYSSDKPDIIHGEDMHCDECVEYVRADIHEALQAKFNRLFRDTNSTCWQCEKCGQTRNGRRCMQCEIDDLKRQLAQCRREALELAARICDGYAAHHIKCRENVAEDDIHSQLAFEYRAHGADDCAEEIRELIEKEGGW